MAKSNFCIFTDDNNDRKSQKVLTELENIDDECDQLGIAFVKIDNDEEAREYGIEKIPTLLYFEKGIPTYYEGNLEEEEKVLEWLRYQAESDEIEDITDEMLDLIIEKMPYVAVLFCKYSLLSRSLNIGQFETMPNSQITPPMINAVDRFRLSREELT